MLIIEDYYYYLCFVYVDSCSCEAGFTGTHCEININDCLQNKCENNSTCIDLVQAYKCKCQSGYMGKIHKTLLYSF